MAYTKRDIAYIHNILKNFYKNRNLHKYEKKFLESANINNLEKNIKKFVVSTSDEFVSLPYFKILIKRAYNKTSSILLVMSQIDKFEYKQFEDDDDFFKSKFLLLKDLRSRIV